MMVPKKQKDIFVTRGDTAQLKFQRRDMDSNPITILPLKIYLTVKKSFLDVPCLFQKTIDDFSFGEDGWCFVTIEPDDTNGLLFGNYVYDIEVITENYKKTLVKGSFIIGPESTSVENEV